MKRIVFIASFLFLIIGGICAGQYGGRRARKTAPASVRREKLFLPSSDTTGVISLERALFSGSDITEYTDKPLGLEVIGQLAWAGEGIKQKNQQRYLELYFVIPAGVYAYNPADHSLEEIVSGDVRNRLAVTAEKDNPIGKAPCSIVVAGSSRRAGVRNTSTANRLMHLEAGQTIQRIQVRAASLGLSSVLTGNFQENQVKRLCGLVPEQDPVMILSVGFSDSVTPAFTGSARKTAVKEIRQRKAIIIIPDRRFSSGQFFNTRDVLEAAGIATVVASWQTGVLKSTDAGTTEATMLIWDIVIGNYDVIVFISGSSTVEYQENPFLQGLAREALSSDKVVAAIGITPVILANAGILNGVMSTCHWSKKDELKKAGAHYTGDRVERDGLIVTGRNRLTASEFGRAITDAVFRRPKPEPVPEGERTGRYAPGRVEKRRQKY